MIEHNTKIHNEQNRMFVSGCPAVPTAVRPEHVPSRGQVPAQRRPRAAGRRRVAAGADLIKISRFGQKKDFAPVLSNNFYPTYPTIFFQHLSQNFYPTIFILHFSNNFYPTFFQQFLSNIYPTMFTLHFWKKISENFKLKFT
jgi:hypothetical protein